MVRSARTIVTALSLRNAAATVRYRVKKPHSAIQAAASAAEDSYIPSFSK